MRLTISSNHLAAALCTFALLAAGCAEGMSPDGADRERDRNASDSPPSSGPEHTESDHGEAETSETREQSAALPVTAGLIDGEADVWRASLESDGPTLRRARSVEQGNAEISVYAASERHDLALVSRDGDLMRLSDLALAPGERDLLRRREPPVQRRVEVWRRAQVRVLVSSKQGRLETAIAHWREPGATVPVLSWSPNWKDGTWFLTSFDGRLAWMDARDVSVDGSRMLDPRYYADRLVMARKIEQRIPHPVVDTETPWAGHPYAGIRVQTRWQARSGRALQNSFGRARGWWSHVNYSLSVWPFLVAKQQYPEEFDTFTVLRPPRDDFEIDDESKRLWRDFFESMRSGERTVRNGGASSTERREMARQLQRSFWRAHVHSLRVGLDRHVQDLDTLPIAERKFALSWGRTTVEYLAAVNFPTDELVGTFFGDALPQSLLRGGTIEAEQNERNAERAFLAERIWELHRYEQKHGDDLLQLVEELVSHLRERGLHRRGYRALRAAIVEERDEGLPAAIRSFAECMLRGASKCG